MKLNKSIMPIILIIMAGAGLLITACAPSAEKLNNQGNDEFARQAYLEALAAYQSAQIDSPELAEPYYNAANALYRQGAYEQALAQMQQALQYAANETLAQNSYYNLGNSSFNSQDWQAAVDAYREALLLNPDDQQAKYNLELALQQLQQQQEEQQQQEQEDQEQDQQQSDAEQNPENEQQQEESQAEGEQNQDSQGGEEDQQSEPRDQSGEGDSQDDERQNESQGDQEQQGQDEEQQEQSQTGQGQPQDGDGQIPASPVPAPGQRMTAEQAQQLLAAIAGDSETLQERLGQIFVVPPIPPVQDW